MLSRINVIGKTPVVLLFALAACSQTQSEAAVRRNQETTQAAATVSSAAQPRQAAAFELFQAAELQRVADEISHGTKTNKDLSTVANYKVMQVRRDKSGGPEVHDDWIDVAVVQAGRATLLVGGRMEGSSLETPGEHRGGKIVGGAPRPVTAGDLFVVPAGVPHQFQLQAGDTIRYLTIKVRRGESTH